MATWNKRATQGALIRLAQSGMIKRFQVRKKKSEDSWATCIQILREPREIDVNNLGFRRQTVANDEPGDDSADELPDESVEGDAMMNDLEMDMLDTTQNRSTVPGPSQVVMNKSSRVPPQWTPNRFLANTVYEAVTLGGQDGWDAGMLRDRIVGPFWRRPMESYFTRLTDDWEKTQPPFLRHLAIIRDSRNTQEKKFLHYVYRTYQNFQKAVDAGVVHWAGVSLATTIGDSSQQHVGKKSSKQDNCTKLNAWGFPVIDTQNFIGRHGCATLSEARSAIVHPRKYGPRWDNALTQEIGYQKTDSLVRNVKPFGKATKSINQVREITRDTIYRKTNYLLAR